MHTDRLWYEDHDNRSLTADYMAEEGYSAKDIARFVEKPWQFEKQFNEAKARTAMERDLMDIVKEHRENCNGCADCVAVV